MPLSLSKRFEIVFLHTHPLGPKLGLGAVAKYVHCSKSAVGNIIKKWNETRDLNDLPKSGRKRITTLKQDKKISELAKKNSDITAAKIKQKIEKYDVNISVNTIRRRLNESGAKYANQLSKPLLTEKHMKKRLQWAKKNKDFDWDKVIFTDESTFRLNQRGRKVWAFPGRKRVFRSVKHPLKIHVWGCFSASGFGKLIYFQRNLNAEYMVSLYEVGLLPSAEILFGAGCVDWFLQEDNDPKHRSKLAGKWKAENDVKILPWPSMSPDQNPIENVWALMKINIAKKKIKTIKGLKSELVKEWNNLSSDLAAKLVSSMKNRVAALIESRGDYTFY
jgi:transposase